MPKAGGRGACTCMHVRGQGLAKAKAGVIGRDRRPRQACFVQGCPAKVSRKDQREDRPLSIEGIYGVTSACMDALTCTNMHVALSCYINKRLSNDNDISTQAQDLPRYNGDLRRIKSRKYRYAHVHALGRACLKRVWMLCSALCMHF
eukprot:366222-Chlamydomonas_euryale.AAC.10